MAAEEVETVNAPLTIAQLHLRAYDARCAVWDVLHEHAARITAPWWQPWEDPRRTESRKPPSAPKKSM